MRVPSPFRAAVLIAALLTPGSVFGDEPAVVTLKVASSPYLSWAPLFIGAAEGYFEKHGIKVEFIQLAGSQDAVATLVANRIDVVPGIFAPAQFNLIARGAGIRFVADKGYVAAQGCGYRGYLARRELVDSGGLENLQQLRGLRIAADRTSPSYYEIERLLAAAGLTSEDVTFIDIPTAAKLAAFERGAIDIAATSEPWITMFVDSGHAILWKTDREIVPNHQHSFILFGPRLLKKDRDAGVRFLMGYLESLRQYNQGKTDRNIDIIARETKLDRDVVARACWTPIRESGEMNVESVIEYQKWAFEQDLLDEIVPVERFWDPSFLEEALRRLPSGE